MESILNGSLEDVDRLFSTLVWSNWDEFGREIDSFVKVVNRVDNLQVENPETSLLLKRCMTLAILGVERNHITKDNILERVAYLLTESSDREKLRVSVFLVKLVDITYKFLIHRKDFNIYLEDCKRAYEFS
jgi:hypothetical protein